VYSYFSIILLYSENPVDKIQEERNEHSRTLERVEQQPQLDTSSLEKIFIEPELLKLVLQQQYTPYHLLHQHKYPHPRRDASIMRPTKTVTQ
jgi:hypothetical protein